jgi:hypothetical protein
MNLSEISIEDLLAEISRRQGEVNQHYSNLALEQIKSLNYNGITTKDFVVIYGNDENYSPKDNPVFQFYLKQSGREKIFDIYYDNTNKRGNTHKWWPQTPESEEVGDNLALEYIPPFLTESCENLYVLHGITLKEGLEKLRACGFNDIRQINENN